jgi:hypothetical protein
MVITEFECAPVAARFDCPLVVVRNRAVGSNAIQSGGTNDGNFPELAFRTLARPANDHTRRNKQFAVADLDG